MPNRKFRKEYQWVSMPCWCGGNEEVFDVYRTDTGDWVESVVECDQCGSREVFATCEDEAASGRGNINRKGS